MSCVMVVGGAGYIGSHAVRALQQAGRRVAVLDNLSTGHREAVKDAAFIHADIRDTDAVHDALTAHEVSAVMHFAADSRVGESQASPEKYYDNNVGGTLSLLKAMRRANVMKLVFSSTAAVYGDAKGLITEQYPKQPANVYGRTKWMIEQMLADYDAAYGMKTIALRYFNAAGADESGDIGEDHSPETHLIPLVFQALGKQKVLTVFGDDYPTKDGTCVRDYIHVIDLSSAHLLALGALESGAESCAYNMGNGKGFTVLEVIQTAGRVTAQKVPYQVGARRPGDPPSLVADSTCIMRELGYAPRFGNLEDIIRTAWRFHERHKDGFGE